MGFIYGLFDPRDGATHYIGKASARKRPLTHAYPNRLALDFTPKARWIRRLIADGVKYGVRVLADAEPQSLDARWSTASLAARAK